MIKMMKKNINDKENNDKNKNKNKNEEKNIIIKKNMNNINNIEY